MARTDPQFNLRIPEEIKDFVKFAAEKNGRSINAEIVHRIVNSISEGEFFKFCDTQNASDGKAFEELESRFVELGYDPLNPEFKDMSIESVNDILSSIFNMVEQINKKIDKQGESS